MIFSNKILYNWIEKSEVVITVGWLIYFLGIILPYPIASLINILSYPIIFGLILLHWRRLSYVTTRNLPLILLLSLAFVSIFWSEVSSETIAGLRGLLRTTMFGVYFATRYSIKEQIKILTWVFGITIIFNLVTCLLFPVYSISQQGEWHGIFPHKNLMARATTLGAILFLLKYLLEKKQRWLMILLFLLSIVLILMSQSKTSLSITLILITILPIFRIVFQYYRTKVIFFSLFCLILGFIVSLIVGNLEYILVDILGKNLEFNGRLPLWTLIIEKTLERPWLGHGYQAFWLSDSGQYVISNSWASLTYTSGTDSFNAHNGYLELLAQLGVLGLFLYTLSFCKILFETAISLVKMQEVEYFFILQFLVFSFFFNLAVGNTILSGNNSYWIIYISFAFSLSLENFRRKRQEKKHDYKLFSSSSHSIE